MKQVMKLRWRPTISQVVMFGPRGRGEGMRMSLLSHCLLWALLLAVLTAAGCKKRETAPGDKSAVPSGQEASAVAPPGPPARGAPVAATARAVVVPDNADVNATLSQLSLELRKYVLRTRSVPRNFEEFVAKSHAQIPPPPAGKKYAIENQAVVLVNR